MTDQLEGSDLDRACAEAMGWNPDGDIIEHCRYSTDPSTQAEKLAWLREHGTLEITQRRATDLPIEALMVYPTRRYAEGTTIDEALARLICSVAKAKKEQGK